MASVQHKVGKSGKRTYYVVVSLRGKHKWLKAGSLKDAKVLKKQIESMEESRRIEKLGIAGRDKRIDDFFQEYAEYVRLRTAPNTLKRYRSVLNTFIVFLRMFHTNLRFLSQTKPDLIESYQKHRLESIELKTEADGDKPKTQTRAAGYIPLQAEEDLPQRSTGTFLTKVVTTGVATGET